MPRVKPYVSLVIPVYNEAAGIERFHSELLTPVLENMPDYQFEVLYINDGSTDNSLRILQGLSKKDTRISIIALSRNFGKEIATSAGISYAKGDATIMLDADGQHPPKYIPEFISLWRKGQLSVTGVRANDEHEGIIKHAGSIVFYKLFNQLAGRKIIPRSTDFRLVDKVVQAEFLKCQERDRFTRGLIDWLGFDSAIVKFPVPPRMTQKASYSLRKLFSLGIASFTSFSLKPLFISAILGSIITLISLIIGIVIIVEQIVLGDPLNLNITGSAMLGVFVSFMVGIVLTSQGIIALYISHIYNQTQGRPLFVVNPIESRNITK